jgi:hypothetical protein
MDLYKLDSLYRREVLIDVYTSLIWTERFNGYGDFELILPFNTKNAQLLTHGDTLALEGSYRVMMVENFNLSYDVDGNAIFKIFGRSLEALLESRAAILPFSNMSESLKWELTGTPAAIARKIFHDICVVGVVDLKDRLPFIIEGSLFHENTIPEPSGEMTIEIAPTSVYAAIQEICASNELGFRIVRNLDTSELYFDVYSGNDRTSAQTVLNPVTFSPEFDKIREMSESSESSEYRNVVYVVSKQGNKVMHAEGSDPDAEGYARKVVVVEVTDMDDIEDVTPEEIDNILEFRGLEALSMHREDKSFEGQIVNLYKYDEDYFLGDIVEVLGTNMVVNFMRVVEQIFVADGEGERVYPSLELYAKQTPGTWKSQNLRNWINYTDTEYWNTFP